MKKQVRKESSTKGKRRLVNQPTGALDSQCFLCEVSFRTVFLMRGISTLTLNPSSTTSHQQGHRDSHLSGANKRSEFGSAPAIVSVQRLLSRGSHEAHTAGGEGRYQHQHKWPGLLIINAKDYSRVGPQRTGGNALRKTRNQRGSCPWGPK